MFQRDLWNKSRSACVKCIFYRDQNKEKHHIYYFITNYIVKWYLVETSPCLLWELASLVAGNLSALTNRKSLVGINSWSRKILSGRRKIQGRRKKDEDFLISSWLPWKLGDVSLQRQRIKLSYFYLHEWFWGLVPEILPSDLSFADPQRRRHPTCISPNLNIQGGDPTSTVPAPSRNKEWSTRWPPGQNSACENADKENDQYNNCHKESVWQEYWQWDCIEIF